MRKSTILKLLTIWCTFLIGSAAWAIDNRATVIEDSIYNQLIDDYAKAGVASLKKLIAQNEANNKEGKSAQNRYVFGFEPFFDTQSGKPFAKLYANGTSVSMVYVVDALNSFLSSVNGALPADKPKIYVGVEEFLGSVLVKTAVKAGINSVDAFKGDNMADKNRSITQTSAAYDAIYTKIAGDNTLESSSTGMLIIGYGTFNEYKVSLKADGLPDILVGQGHYSSFRGSGSNGITVANAITKTVFSNEYSPFPSSFEAAIIAEKLKQFAARIAEAMLGKIDFVDCSNFIGDTKTKNLTDITEPSKLVTFLKKFDNDCFKFLSISDRVYALTKLVEGNLVDSWMGLANNSELIALKLLDTTPVPDIQTLLNELKNKKILPQLLIKIDGDNFSELINVITSYVMNLTPPPNIISSFALVKNLGARAVLTFSSWDGLEKSVDVVTSQLHLKTRKNFDLLYNQEVSIDPYEYLLVRFDDDFSIGKKFFLAGQRDFIPAIFCYGIFNEQLNRNTKLAIDEAFLVTGLGGIIEYGSQQAFKALALEIIDIGISSIDISLNNFWINELSQTEDGRAILSYWNTVAMAYGGVRLSTAMIPIAKTLLTKLENFKITPDISTADKELFGNITQRVRGLVNYGGNILTHLVEADIIALQKITTTLRSGGVRAINNVKNLVNEGKALVVKPIANSPLAQKMDDYITAFTNNNSTLQGQLGEEIAELMGKEINATGDVLNIKINNSGNGFDVLSFAPNKTNPTSVRIFEAKPLNGTSVELPNTVSGGTQMSDQWTRYNIGLMRQSADNSIKQIGDVMNQLIQQNKLERYVVTVDKDLKQVIILKLDNF